MQLQSTLQKKLEKNFGAAVQVTVQEGVATLSGQVEHWQQVVAAGRLCADKKRRWTVVNDLVCPEYTPKAEEPAMFDSQLEGLCPDVLVIGGGVVGCAIARELTRWQLKVLLVEKEHDLALHASGRNDGMVHPGIDLHKGQVKQAYNARGNRMFGEVCEQLGVPFKRSGQFLGFDKPWMKPLLWVAPIHWKRMGVPCRYVSGSELHRLEPEVNPKLCCALAFSSAGVVCPYGLTIAYAENAVQNGAQLSLDTQVLGMQLQKGSIHAVRTNRGTVYPKVVINAAGVFCEEIAKMAGDRFYSIHPRKGTNFILDKKAAHQVRTIASSLGSAATKTTHSKGGGVVHTVDDNLLVGPDAQETWEKENFETGPQSAKNIFEKQKRAVPTLSPSDIITYFTGIRAATYEEDFVIETGRKTRNLVHAAGIQSPGLTAAPAIGVDVAAMAVELLKQQGTEPATNPAFDPCRAVLPKLAELPDAQRDALIRQNPELGVIVCRCEEVSRGEIIDALHRPVPCDTVDGVKRRVRPGMGRCQGGFCGPLVAQIIAEELNIPLAQVQKSGAGSHIMAGETKEVRRSEQHAAV